MAGAFINISVDDTIGQDLLQQVEKRAGSMRPAMKIIGEIITNSVYENFMAGGRPQPWKPLAQSTLWNLAGGSAGHTRFGMKKDTRRTLSNKKILVGRGQAGGLMSSIHPDPQDTYVDVGTEKPYGAIHQFGGKTRPHEIRPVTKKALAWPDALHPAKVVHHPGSDIPARPYLVIQDQDLPAMRDAITDYLAQPATEGMR